MFNLFTSPLRAGEAFGVLYSNPFTSPQIHEWFNPLQRYVTEYNILFAFFEDRLSGDTVWQDQLMDEAVSEASLYSDDTSRIHGCMCILFNVLEKHFSWLLIDPLQCRSPFIIVEDVRTFSPDTIEVVYRYKG